MVSISVYGSGLEHCATEDIEIRGYKIRKGTTIEANIWYFLFMRLLRSASNYKRR